MLQQRVSDTQWKTISGIIDAIRSTFYPQYDYFSSMNVAKRRRWRPRKEPAPPCPHFVDWKKEAGVDGQELGKLIDREFDLCVRHLIRHGVPLTQTSIDEMTISPYCRELLMFHYRNKWQPLFSQFSVVAPGLNVGTRIDEICFDASGRIIVVELKYGYNEYREFGTAYMNSPLDDCLDSPQNQHILQCGLAALMLQRFWGVQIGGGFVVYITDGEVHPVPVGDWFWRRADKIWDAFSTQMTKRF